MKDTDLHCQVSIGAALSDETLKTADEMLIQSDFALYDVKRSGRGKVVMYNQDLHQRRFHEIELANDLRHAIDHKELSFHFQPIIGSQVGEIRGVETLVRWDHPQHGMLSPAAFLPIAQTLGVMAQIDDLALNAALDLKTKINKASHVATKVSFNASPEFLADDGVLTRLCFALDSRGLNRDDLVIEVLETVIFQNCDGETSHVKILGDIGVAGILAVLDDFGSGHAGLAHLAKLPIAGLKIDASLIKDVLTDKNAETILSTLITLCHDLDLRATTEGVETQDQAGKLAQLGSHTIQGYWIARPMPETALLKWLEARAASDIAPDNGPRYLKAN